MTLSKRTTSLVFGLLASLPMVVVLYMVHGGVLNPTDHPFTELLVMALGGPAILAGILFPYLNRLKIPRGSMPKAVLRHAADAAIGLGFVLGVVSLLLMSLVVCFFVYSAIYTKNPHWLGVR